MQLVINANEITTHLYFVYTVCFRDDVLTLKCRKELSPSQLLECARQFDEKYNTDENQRICFCVAFDGVETSDITLYH